MPLVAYIYTAKKSIFVEGLHFYLEHDTVRAVWSHNKVYLIYWALIILRDLLFGTNRNNGALQHSSLTVSLGICTSCDCVRTLVSVCFSKWSCYFTTCVTCTVCDVMKVLLPHRHWGVHVVNTVMTQCCLTAFLVCFLCMRCSVWRKTEFSLSSWLIFNFLLA